MSGAAFKGAHDFFANPDGPKCRIIAVFGPCDRLLRMKDQIFPPRRGALAFTASLLLSACGLKSALTLPPQAPARPPAPQPDASKPKAPDGSIP